MKKVSGVSTSLSKPTELSIQTAPPTSRRIGRGWWIGGIIVLLLTMTLALAGSGWFDAPVTGPSSVAVAAIARENLVVSVDQPGQLEAREKKIIRSEVRGAHELLWIIDEGSQVKTGDVLVRLDPTDRKERVAEQEQAVKSAFSAEVSAKVNFENTESQSKSNVEKAELDLEFAQLELTKYVEGAYPQELMKAQADVEIARETFKRASTTADWSRKLLEQGYITESEADADTAAATKAQLDLKVAQGKLEVLEKYTYLQEKRRLESDVEQKAAALDRTRKKAEADVLKASVEWNTAIAKLDRDKIELEQDLLDLKNCDIRSTADGRVVYAPQGDRWRREEPLSVGSPVNYGREIIHLPVSGAMSVAIKIEEAQRDKVEVGMPVLITGPNLPDAGFRGTLVHIAEYLDPSGWWNNDLKVYSATVDINDDQDVSALRTGMNCKTQILVASYRDVLVAPLQAVTMVDGKHVVYLADEPTTPLPVEIGLDNGRKVHILSGINAGQKVLLDPPLPPSAKPDDQPQVGVEVTPPASTKTKKPAPSEQKAGGEDRMLKMLVQLQASGMMDKLELDESAKTAIRTAVQNINAGKPAELDESTRTKLRAAMRKLRPAGADTQAQPKSDS